MKKFTGKVTNVDNNGNPIKKKSTGKNGKKSGFKKPASVKKSSGKKPLKDITAVMTKKPVHKIVEYYYFFDEEMDARKLQSAVGEKWFEKADIWPELNLMEVEMLFLLHTQELKIEKIIIMQLLMIVSPIFFLP